MAMTDFEVTYEKLFYAAPIVNSIRRKWGFRGLDGPLGWAAGDGQFTYLGKGGKTAVLCASEQHAKMYNLQPELFVGSHRDIASATRQYLLDIIVSDIDHERREYGRNRLVVNANIRRQEAVLKGLVRQRNSMVESPSYIKYQSIKQKKNKG